MGNGVSKNSLQRHVVRGGNSTLTPESRWIPVHLYTTKASARLLLLLQLKRKGTAESALLNQMNIEVEEIL